MNKRYSMVSASETAFWSAFSVDSLKISLPDNWSSIWCDFGAWLITDSSFGVLKFAAPTHRSLMEEMARMCDSHCCDSKLWSALTDQACFATSSARSTLIDEECVASVAAACAFAQSVRTARERWALIACAAAAVTRARGWAVHGRACSQERIYTRALEEALLAQAEQVSYLLSLVGLRQTRQAA